MSTIKPAPSSDSSLESHADMELLIEINQAALKAICTRYGVQKLSLFGSAIHGGFGPDSDVDMLVEFQPSM